MRARREPGDRRDGQALPTVDASALDELAARWREHGLELTAFAPVDEATVGASGSSWARRLGAGRDRSVWQLGLLRSAAGAIPPELLATRR